MTDKFLEKLKKAKDAIRFEAERKDAGRNRLLQYIEARERAGTRSDPRLTVRGLLVSFANTFSKPLPVLAAVAIAALVLAGGGTSLAAQRALPGDLLYPLKVGLTEKVVGALQFSGAARAEYHIILAARRLDEAGKLAARGDASAESQAELAEQFDAHAKDAEREIAEVSTRGKVRDAADIASRFETDLRVNTKLSASARAQTGATKGDDGKNGNSLRARVRGALNDVVALRMKLERKVTAQAAAQANDETSKRTMDEACAAAVEKVRAAVNLIAATRAYLDLKRSSLDAQAVADAEARLKAADDFVARASVSIEAESYGEAFNFGNEAIRTAQEIKSLMRAKADLNLNVDLREDLRDRTPDVQSENGGGPKLQIATPSYPTAP